jgi:hypothetical protein
MRPNESDTSQFSYDPLGKTYQLSAREGHLAGWVANGRYDLINGRLVVTSLSVRYTSDEIPPNGITGTLLRSIHPAFITDRIRSEEARYGQWLAKGISDVDPASADEKSLERLRQLLSRVEELTKAPRSGPTGVRGASRLDDEFLADVARLHVQEVLADGNYGAKTRLAKDLDKPYNTVKGWLKLAKDRGLYPESAEIRADATE